MEKSWLEKPTNITIQMCWIGSWGISMKPIPYPTWISSGLILAGDYSTTLTSKTVKYFATIWVVFEMTTRHTLKGCKIDANFHRVISDEIDRLLLLANQRIVPVEVALGSVELAIEFHKDDDGLPIENQPFMTITINKEVE